MIALVLAILFLIASVFLGLTYPYEIYGTTHLAAYFFGIATAVLSRKLFSNKEEEARKRVVRRIRQNKQSG